MKIKLSVFVLFAGLLAFGINANAAPPWANDSWNDKHEDKKYNNKHKNRHEDTENQGRGIDTDRSPRSSWVRGGPPPWAPAHGYRRKHNDRHYHDTYDERYPDPMIEAEFEQDSQRIGIVVGTCNREVVGAVAGGIFGGIIGNKTADSEHKQEATILGALIGVVVGKEIGRRMDKSDMNCNNQVLERAHDGQTVTWKNPDTHHHYSVTPYETYQRNDEYCRKYKTVVQTRSGSKEYVETSCREDDGVWRVKS